MRQFIIDQLMSLDVIDEKKVIEYVDFCLDKNQKKRVKYSTSHHHILPQSKTLPFKDFSCLKSNQWNGSHLLFCDHYKAHWLFTQAINDYGQLHAFLLMHNKDFALRRIKESELLDPEIIQQLMVERHAKQLKYENTTIDTEFGKMTNKEYASLKSSIKKNSDQWKNDVGKPRILKFKNTMLTPFIDESGHETTLSKQISKQSATTMSKTTFDENGNEITIYKQSAIKTKKTKNKVFIDENGNETTINKEAGKKVSKTLNKIYIDETGNQTSISKERGKKCSITKNKVFIDENGNETTIASISGKLAKITRSKKFIDENGNETSIDKENGKKLKERYEKNAKRYVVKNAITNEVYGNMLLRDIRKLSCYLFDRTKEDYLGKRKESRSRFINSKKEYLIGLYVEK